MRCGTTRPSPPGLLEADNSEVRGKNGYASAPVERTEASGWLWSWALAIPTTSSKADLAWRYIAWATGPQYIKEAGPRIAGGWAAIPPGTRRSTYAIPEYRKAARAFAQPTLDAIEVGPGRQPGHDQAARHTPASTTSASPSSRTSATSAPSSSRP